MAEILGTAANDLLVGTAENDNVFGLEGNDTLNGSLGDDTLFGNQGIDFFQEAAGNDTIFGGKDGDLIVDTQGNNQIFGNLGDDLIFGGVGNDLIYGGQDNDNLSGDVGDDFLSGDKGDDLLVGVSFASANPGRGELDTLSGGAGIDVFALGDATRTYYLGTGLNDVALLIDFAPAEDLIAVSTTNNLSISAFSLAGIGEGTGIFSSGDLIAFAPGIGADQITIGVNVFPVPIPNT